MRLLIPADTSVLINIPLFLLVAQVDGLRRIVFVVGLFSRLVLLDVSPFWQQVIKGFVILLAVILDRFSKK